MRSGNRPPDRGSTGDIPESDTEPDPSMGVVGVWILFGLLTAGLALVSFTLSIVGGEHDLLRSWMVTFGYREFALVNAVSAVLSFSIIYRLYTAKW